MAHKFEAQLEKWHKFIASKDAAILDELLADAAVFRSPVAWKPKEGKAATMLYLTSAVEVLQNFQYHRTFVSDDSLGLEFSATVSELTLKGIDLIRFDPAGKIIDFEVMVRPASGLQALGAEMGKRLAQFQS
jgi:hypothetical protein